MLCSAEHKGGYLKNAGDQTILVTIDFHCMVKQIIIKILQYYFLCTVEQSAI